MGRSLHYRPGSYYVTDDRTGFPQRAERTRKEWQGLRVDWSVWEPRQPQDLVRGLPDYQAVPDPRPIPAPVWSGPTEVSLSAPAITGQSVLVVASFQGLTVGDAVGLMLDSGEFFNTTLKELINPDLAVLNARIPSPASSGNLLYDYHVQGPL